MKGGGVQRRPTDRAGSNRTGSEERFEYPESLAAAFAPSWEGWQESWEEPVAGKGASGGAAGALAPPAGRAGPVAVDSIFSGSVSPSGSSKDALDADPEELDGSVAEEQRRAFAAGYERGLQAGLDAGREAGLEEGREERSEAERAARAAVEERRIAQIAAAIESFAGERDRYLQTLERGAARLALAVAGRILRREAEADPLLVSGAVRVALGQVAAATEVRLRVPPAELDLWKEAMAAMPNLALRPMVAVGEGMELGECILETDLGTADLGIRAQLAEVERVLFGGAAVGSQHEKKPSEENAA